MKNNFSNTFVVGWTDVDLNGHARNTLYSDYASITRVSLFDKEGLTFHDLIKEHKVGAVLLQEFINYKRELRLSDRVRVDLYLLAASSDYAYYQILHKIYNTNKNKICCILTISGCWIDMETRKISTPPKKAQNILCNLSRARDFKHINKKQVILKLALAKF